ncbi:hypothetical protein GCM10027067_26980 [Pseudactinotalea suaedae]
MQRELLDRHASQRRRELASATFERIEGFYNPRRRHSTRGNRSPAECEAQNTAANPAA